MKNFFLQDKESSKGKLWKNGQTYGLTHLCDDRQILEEFCPFTKEERQTILYCCNLYDVNLAQVLKSYYPRWEVSCKDIINKIFNFAIKNVASKLINIYQYLEAEPIFGKRQRKLTRVREFIKALYSFVERVISRKFYNTKFFQPKKYDRHNENGFLTLVGQDLLDYILKHFFDIRKELKIYINN